MSVLMCHRPMELIMLFFFFVRSLYCLVPNNKSKLCWELLIYVDCRYSKKFDDDF